MVRINTVFFFFFALYDAKLKPGYLKLVSSFSVLFFLEWGLFIIFILKLSFVNLLWKKRKGVGDHSLSYVSLRGERTFSDRCLWEKKSTLWLSNIDQAVLGSNPKQLVLSKRVILHIHSNRTRMPLEGIF